MKKLMVKIAAASAAWIMAVSVFGSTVSAYEQLRDSWVMTDSGWGYVSADGTFITDRLAKIDGVLYKFNSWAHQHEKYSGWTKSDGVKRRYSNGLPYTGWLKYADGRIRYCLDGYMATDNMQIGDHIYTFDDDGFYTEKTALTLITKCDKIISNDTDEIRVALKNLDGCDYSFSMITEMQRWEKGEWINCHERWGNEDGAVAAYPSIGYNLNEKGEIKELEFNPQIYTGYNLIEGYYRIPIKDYFEQQYITYATFQVVPPVTVETTEEIYFCNGSYVNVDYTAALNSEKLQGTNIGYESTIYKMTENGWRDITEYTENDGTISTEQAVLEEGYSDTELVYGMPVESGTGYYKAVVTIDGKEYADYFRIEELDAKPWLEEYSNKDKNLTVTFDIYNGYEKSVEVSLHPYDIYRMENGRWVDVSEARTLYVDCELAIITLESGKKMTVSVNVSECYDVSKLEAGEYAVYIGGCGYETFTVTDKKVSKNKLPFGSLDYNDIEKIELLWNSSDDDVITKPVVLDNVYMRKAVAFFRQFKLGSEYEDYESHMPAGGSFDVIVTLKDGTETKLRFLEEGVVLYNGKWIHCNEYLYHILEDIVYEFESGGNNRYEYI